MDRIRIRGGRRLNGMIPISGAKNAGLPLMAASLLTDETLTLTNVPDLADISSMAELLRHLGVAVAWKKGKALGEGGRVALTAGKAPNTFAPYDVVRKMRASFLVLGPLLARLHEAKVSLPGGCAIGARPVDLHLKGLAAMGAELTLSEGYVLARAPGGLKGATFRFPSVSVGGTENLMMAASLAHGRTILENAAREPEIVNLGECLAAMGAKISGLGTSTVTIHGTDRLHGAEHAVIPDRIETGTYAIAAAIAGGEVRISGGRADHIAPLLELLSETGATIESNVDGFTVKRGNARPKSRDMETEPYPGFPTDLQAQYIALMSVSEGVSRVKETIFENRFMHVPELARMGANIQVSGDTATVTGPALLKGAPVMATDLRASVSLVLAALAAEGETIVNRVYHLDRGFERIEEKLGACGADIERLTT